MPWRYCVPPILESLPKAQSAIFLSKRFNPSQERISWNNGFNYAKGYQALFDQSWFGHGPKEHAEFRMFRHAIPVLVNKILRQYHQTKIGTDFTVPRKYLFDLLGLYRQKLEDSGLRYCIFGHIADNHLHVNLLPQNDEESERGWRLYRQIARQIIAWGGTISAEHGVGKIRREYLLDMFDRSGLREMSLIKKRTRSMLNFGQREYNSRRVFKRLTTFF